MKIIFPHRFPLPLMLGGLAVLVLAIIFLIDAAISPAFAQGAASKAMNPPTNAARTSADELYCEKRKLGYWFYCTKPKQLEADETQTLPPEVQTSASEQLDAVTKELRELKAKAILQPTRENVIAYIRFQREQLDRASLFSDVWQRAIWQQPDLDYTLERPVSTLAKRQ